MDSSLLAIAPSLMLFCFISTVTPGPNNILLAHSGAQFGIAKTLPHILGIRTGMTLLHLTILSGLGQVFQRWPVAHTICAYIASAYIIYMAVKIAFAKVHSVNNKAKPMGVIQAAAFQVINPKSWASLITASSVFTLNGDLFWPSALLGVVMFNTATIPGTFMWVTIGKLVSGKLQQPEYNRMFNMTMGLLLLTTLPMIFR
ncbi:Cysteine/O-acetylserine efflux protein [Vibrio aerogenes CECT 7868]|uniref:Cysteine/O-acetylserine efflux protein n=1 Tax=Vibrio aerogenes CECT 7868 TaxID=1216006 RepID=A0A1M6A6M4_9VIBR|nr:LysE family translocator [Vibrio aerogenes]SHI32085.1 Cysteine/O-acetylserine efflux protein [Vibrio aerogenes CECT 7868]